MELIDVHLLGIPLAMHQRAVEHSAEVMREFSHLLEEPGLSHAPARLIAIDRELQDRFGPFTQMTSAELDQAVAGGDEVADVTFTVPSDLKDATEEVGRLWDEVERYCEAGEYLLTLRSPPEVVAYREWFLGQFCAQADGNAPVTWRAWLSVTNQRFSDQRQNPQS